MAVRQASAGWNGDLKAGSGKMKLGSGSYEGPYSFTSRFEDGSGTNPEELIGAAHAGCFSMALSHILASKGFSPKSVNTQAKVNLTKVGEGFKITSIELTSEGNVPGIDEKTFLEHANAAKTGCPVSQALTGTEIKLNAKLVQN